eukprot:SAG31_NODE_1748_length_7363_cov_288.231553_4_plen_93_part_00
MNLSDDLGSLILMFIVNASMNLFGLLMEKMNPPNRKAVDWSPFIYGCVAGIAPWIVVVQWVPFSHVDCLLCCVPLAVLLIAAQVLFGRRELR